MEPQVFIDYLYDWKEHAWGEFTVKYIGNEKAVRDFERLLPKEGKLDKNAFSSGLSGIVGNFAAIVEGQRWIVAVVDKIRSYPIFYIERDGSFCVSNSARFLKKKLSLSEIDDISLLEFRMAGYVTGRETLYKFLYQLQAGELIVWDKINEVSERKRYYLFYSQEIRQESEDELIDELDYITNNIFQRIIEEAKGAPIWVPLSGGLDSRLVLCKLKQLNYGNLAAYSYGPPGNYEAKAAGYVAEKIGVPWVFMPSTMKNAKKYFRSGFRRKYWDFSDSLCSLPYNQDIQCLWENRDEEIIPQDAIVINGNSGDFITGGHIPEYFINMDSVNMDMLIDSVIQKHFSSWLSLKTTLNMEKIKGKLKSLLKIDERYELMPQVLAKHLEWWEWQERQSKYVVNGQRNYDFLGLSWELPLWADEYLFFWRTIPLQMKCNQTLYKSYLLKKDFFGLFRDFPIKIWRWPGPLILIIPIVRIIKLILGAHIAENIYRFLSYWGHYRNLYAQYGMYPYFKNIFDMRGFNSLTVNQWLNEENIFGDM